MTTFPNVTVNVSVEGLDELRELVDRLESALLLQASYLLPKSESTSLFDESGNIWLQDPVSSRWAIVGGATGPTTAGRRLLSGGYLDNEQGYGSAEEVIESWGVVESWGTTRETVFDSYCLVDGKGRMWVQIPHYGWSLVASPFHLARLAQTARPSTMRYPRFDDWERIASDSGIDSGIDSYYLVDKEGDGWVWSDEVHCWTTLRSFESEKPLLQNMAPLDNFEAGIHEIRGVWGIRKKKGSNG